MKYFTKEYYALVWLSYANQFIKVSKKAEQKDEDFYQRVYKKHYLLFSHVDKLNECYKDPIEELRKIDDLINEPNITEEERNRRKMFKKLHEELNRERIQRGTYFEFDEAVCKKKFAEQINGRMALYRRLPQEILDKVADIRILALGYGSAEMKQLLRPYCMKLRRTVRQIKSAAYAETDEAESYLTNALGLNDYEEVVITAIKEENGEIYLKGEDERYLLFKQGEILEGKDKTIIPFDRDIPNSGWSLIVAAELHRIEDKFEAHFLVSNCDEIDREDLWYLTIRGKDILENG